MFLMPITDPRSFVIPVVTALLIQGSILFLMSTHWMDTEFLTVKQVPSHIAARIVQIEKPKPKISKKPTVKPKAIPSKKAKPPAKTKAAPKPKKPVPVKQVPVKQVPAKKDVKPEPAPKQALTEAQKSAALAELAESLEAEEAFEQENISSDQEQEAVSDVSSQIRALIERVWRYPPSAKHTDTVVVRLYLVPTGEVTEVQIVQSSGNEALDRSAEQAVWKVGTFPVPDDPIVFERNFRRFKLELTPETARL